MWSVVPLPACMTAPCSGGRKGVDSCAGRVWCVTSSDGSGPPAAHSGTNPAAEWGRRRSHRCALPRLTAPRLPMPRHATPRRALHAQGHHSSRLRARQLCGAHASVGRAASHGLLQGGDLRARAELRGGGPRCAVILPSAPLPSYRSGSGSARSIVHIRVHVSRTPNALPGVVPQEAI